MSSSHTCDISFIQASAVKQGFGSGAQGPRHVWREQAVWPRPRRVQESAASDDPDNASLRFADEKVFWLF
jgi:hypothetical protein